MKCVALALGDDFTGACSKDGTVYYVNIDDLYFRQVLCVEHGLAIAGHKLVTPIWNYTNIFRMETTGAN